MSFSSFVAVEILNHGRVSLIVEIRGPTLK